MRYSSTLDGPAIRGAERRMASVALSVPDRGGQRATSSSERLLLLFLSPEPSHLQPFLSGAASGPRLHTFHGPPSLLFRVSFPSSHFVTLGFPPSGAGGAGEGHVPP